MTTATEAFEITFALRGSKIESDGIAFVGGQQPDGKRWLIAKQSVIQAIEKKTCRFVIRRHNRLIDVHVGIDAGGVKRLETVLDRPQSTLVSGLPAWPPGEMATLGSVQESLQTLKPQRTVR